MPTGLRDEGTVEEGGRHRFPTTFSGVMPPWRTRPRRCWLPAVVVAPRHLEVVDQVARLRREQVRLAIAVLRVQDAVE